MLGDIVRQRLEDYRQFDYRGAGVPTRATRQSRPSFAEALSTPVLGLIAEIKRSSPSQGRIAELLPGDAAAAYQAGGAAAISVLTEARHFGGSLDHLRAVVRRVALPVLRKDFVVHPRQVTEAASVGASAVLLIARVLGRQLLGYLSFTHRHHLDALVEVHNEEELNLALEAGAGIIGVNNRDLATLAIDLKTAPRLFELARRQGFSGRLVAESGYRCADDIDRVRGLADAVLVGTSLAGSGDLERSTRALLGASRE